MVAKDLLENEKMVTSVTTPLDVVTQKYDQDGNLIHTEIKKSKSTKTVTTFPTPESLIRLKCRIPIENTPVG
ncbi:MULTISPECIES: hypothetical protein [unclassified Moorena]|uniref:hypothetical protein n=1 Tax=unclassified Moorena TaxID=2683338 RepID=UPI0013C64EA3|nr:MULTISPECIES: hypothetical protein [unclassified Moorena]NEO17886.1 hypothetical protein [Moorena sp. SIO4A5]NEQ59866.1 hypothetical protein [Moorena sp. SIO4A1]